MTDQSTRTKPAKAKATPKAARPKPEAASKPQAT